MGFVTLLETACGNGVGKNKECFLGAELFVKPLDQKIVLMVEHCLETHTTDVAVCGPINSIAERHVVGRHSLGDGACCAADPKESACYFLAGANFSEGSVLARIQINLESLLVGADLHLRTHTISVRSIANR